MSGADEDSQAVIDARRAMSAIRLEVPASVADDVAARVEAVIAELDAYKRAKAENDERFQLEAAGLREERDRLRNTCWRLAAPLEWAADGTTDSALSHITEYVRALESRLAE